MSLAEQLIFGILLSIVGAGCTFFPRKIQGLATATTKIKAIKDFAQSRAYLIMVRIVGAACFAMAGIVIWLSFAGVD